MRNILIGILLIVISTSSCKKKTESTNEKLLTESYKTNVKFKTIESDWKQWWAYHYNTIKLSQNFIAINDSSEEISKQEFLKKLTSGDYIPLKIETEEDDKEKYQLFKLDSNADEGISNTIKNVALVDYKHFQMETNDLPEFQFTDIDGKTFNNETIKGKTTLIKTWFIKCKACVAEFPELNELVGKYEDRDDILFISLALNSKSDLEKFLIKNEFKYKIVPDQTEFIEEKLNLQIYPTHLLINENGRILKVTNKASDMLHFIEAYDILSIKKDRNLPPPPPAPSR